MFLAYAAGGDDLTANRIIKTIPASQMPNKIDPAADGAFFVYRQNEVVEPVCICDHAVFHSFADSGSGMECGRAVKSAKQGENLRKSDETKRKKRDHQ